MELSKEPKWDSRFVELVIKSIGNNSFSEGLTDVFLTANCNHIKQGLEIYAALNADHLEDYFQPYLLHILNCFSMITEMRITANRKQLKRLDFVMQEMNGVYVLIRELKGVEGS